MEPYDAVAYPTVLYCTVFFVLQAIAADAFLAFDSSGRLTSINKPAEALFGARGNEGKTEFSDIFLSVAGITASMDTEGTPLPCTVEYCTVKNST